MFNIKSTGLYVGIRPDSLRGDAGILSACAGFDRRVHLCGHMACSEEGKCFKAYGLANSLDPERSQLQQAQNGVIGQRPRAWWASVRKPVEPPAPDVGSELETSNLRMNFTGTLSQQNPLQASRRSNVSSRHSMVIKVTTTPERCFVAGQGPRRSPEELYPQQALGQAQNARLPGQQPTAASRRRTSGQPWPVRAG